ncbi:MAG: phospholipase C, phosphocholine-specific [Asticcacaulis sp.]|nr:phospholipase C, phosphocholine-specific [Asticcacaulis sp.]
MTLDRRRFVATAATAALASSLPATAATRGSLADVEHVVILMQENRSFDHYFGALRGVRGFDDPHPWIQPAGAPAWQQRQDDKDGGDVIGPFHLDTETTAAGCIKSLDHSWKGSHDRWKHWNVWMPEKGPFSMGYMTRADIAYYYALADQFTICDAYHASIHGPTGPNRLFLFSGSSGLSAGHEGIFNIDNGGVDDNPGADMARDDAAFAGLQWTPYAARLEAAGISWRVYQEYDNFSDNPLGYFACFRKLDPQSQAYARARAWVPGSTKDNAGATRGEHLIAAFAADVAADRLPQVSWIVAPFPMSEHPDAPPAYGEVLTARLVAALAANPDVWAKTVFILNYDENDGFFDHVPPPIPPTRPGMGASTVDLAGETYRGEPVGLGPRVPLIVVSPWTRGGFVNSQLSDHTSVLRFLERRFGVLEPNISPWRRAVCGDLLSMFDFNVDAESRRDTSWLRKLPAVDRYLDDSDTSCRLPAPAIATEPMPQQEPGTRPARPLPYRVKVVATRHENELSLRFVNNGRVAATFIAALPGETAGPWHYTVGAGETLSGVWPVPDAGLLLAVHGPGGFYQTYDSRHGLAPALLQPY